MKRFSFLLFLVLFLSCQLPTDTVIEEYYIENDYIPEVVENIAPGIILSPASSTVRNASSLTFSVDIDDPDDFYFYYSWTVDGEFAGADETLSFCKSPEIGTEYTVTVEVFDGENTVSASSVITVLEPPWEPTPLTIYFFPVGTEPGDELWLRLYTAEDNDDYSRICGSIRTTLEIYNRDHDPDAYILYGGYE